MRWVTAVNYIFKVNITPFHVLISRYELLETSALYIASAYARPGIVQWLLGKYRGRSDVV